MYTKNAYSDINNGSHLSGNIYNPIPENWPHHCKEGLVCHGISWISRILHPYRQVAFRCYLARNNKSIRQVPFNATFLLRLRFYVVLLRSFSGLEKLHASALTDVTHPYILQRAKVPAISSRTEAICVSLAVDSKSKLRTLCQSRRQRREIINAYLQWYMNLYPRVKLHTRVRCALILTNQSKPTLKYVYLPKVRAARELRLWFYSLLIWYPAFAWVI